MGGGVWKGRGGGSCVCACVCVIKLLGNEQFCDIYF